MGPWVSCVSVAPWEKGKVAHGFCADSQSGGGGPLRPRAAFPRLQHARWKILKRWDFHDFLPQFLLFFGVFFGFLCKFSTKLPREEMSAIGPHFASASCDRGGEGGAAAAAAAGKQRSGEHQRPQSHQHFSLSLPHEPVAPRVLSAELGWEKTYF